MADPTATAAPNAHTAFDIEKPDCFYLGREYDLAKKAVLPDKFVMYDARDLTTHGVVVGMTGSGKTGLCISLLEEAAIDGIPCVIIDPKGDLTNLLLQFPDLDPRHYEEWLNEDDAHRKGLSPQQYAKRPGRRLAQGAGGLVPDAGSHRPPQGVVGPAHLHAGQRGRPAAVDPRRLRRPQDEDAARGADTENRRHGHRPARPHRHHRRSGAIARAHPHRAIAAERVDGRRATSTCRS